MPDASPASRGSSWQSVVGALTSADPRENEPTTPMGLQFEVRELSPRTHDRWRGPTAKTATDAEADPTTRPPRRLGVRPVIRAASGSYVKANVTWGSFAHQLNRLNLDPEHHRWFAQFAALHRATREGLTPPETDWLNLDDFASPLLWQLLAEGERRGIELLTSAKGGSVRVLGRASVGLDARLRPGGALQLTPTVAFGTGAGEGAGPAADAPAPTDWPATDTGPIGDHGVYGYARLGERPEIVLAPTAAPLTPGEQGLLGQPTLRIPSAETAQFFDEYYPSLQQGVTITSPDGSLELPEVPPPVLVLTARFRSGDVLQLDWDWVGQRDPAAEKRILATTAVELDAVLVRFPPRIDPLSPSLTLRGVEAAAFAERALPMLDALDGVRVDVIGPRPSYRELDGHPDVTITMVESLKRDWFDLGIVVNMNGYRIPFGPLFKALAKGQKKLLMVNKTYLRLDHPAFDRLRELLEEAGTLDEWETGVRLSKHQVSLWSDFDDLADESIEAESWRAAVAGLRDVESVEPTPLPAGVNGVLRPYQKAGFDWLAFLWRHRLGGVLADDMGLGKTLQTLALIAHARESAATAEPDVASRPFLVVAPTSVVSNWADESARFTPGLTVRPVTATQAKSPTSLSEVARGADVVVTSYTLFRLDFEAYQSLGWAGLVLDEAQFVKNHASKLHARARELDVDFTLAITGTPLENNLMELWSLFDLVAPGLFPSHVRFAEHYQRPIERGIDPRLLTRLRRRIRPFLLRRTKEAVAPELPEKQEQVLHVELAPAHRHLYDTVLQRERQKLFGLIEDLDRNRFIVFRSLTLLRMLSLDATLIDEAHASVPSSKLEVLVENLGEVVAEGHRSLVFSQFTSYLTKVAVRLDAEGIAYEYLDGSTRRRAEVISRFREGDAPVFLISLKAGGFGLTLTEADYVYLLDPWWNPASETQAIDRTHRIGQTHPVNVYRLVASGTIEEKVMALKEHKAKLFDAVLDDDALFSQALTADDIRGLLA
ncbi:DEAD/DEAH box helicase [Herbiconiux ginsengi]|uniref:Superfamily II DNA or RNA helicase, SNF2 family n=1 Tax=Herbiconiux ginsengi TaxID=381665 RepID=A0A1H3LBN0_9MICO|nr:DEAD/DEAH box helicase [Herbiconiux ginsengi]SDY61812.1 Superfamily II DNA or RNA helicase, SNF2 family [Herbiconiux ginsengi]